MTAFSERKKPLQLIHEPTISAIQQIFLCSIKLHLWKFESNYKAI